MASGGFSGSVIDPEQCSQLSFEEKRDLACKIAQWPNNAWETLSSFTRRELLQIICAEMGKERKYSGYTKSQLIKQLLKVVSQNCKGNDDDADKVKASCASVGAQNGVKRKRLNEFKVQSSTEENPPDSLVRKKEQVEVQVCQNAACRASLSSNDAFCRRCSCCICHYYDENKDPSLWLTCGSDSCTENSCGFTCHLVCALKDKRSGIVNNTGSGKKLDGSFYCVSCGKVNGLMRIWRKQLLIAKEARRVDVLCLRVLLAHKLLSGTEQYNEIHKMMETALQLLKNELGPLDLVCTKMARGIVNRLSCGSEVQKLCASAIESFDLKSSGDCPGYEQKKEAPPWFLSARGTRLEECSPRPAIEAVALTNHGSFSPSTPCKSSETQDVSGFGCKRRAEESEYEYSVRAVKWLEQEGQIEEGFRVKFLTWFSLKATAQERRVVNAFVDALVDHPPSLAEQLKHAFMDEICCDQKPVAECGSCARLRR
ncbi:unnamed protein product [Linum tenue]|uniref:Oberon PHD finger domain-containing protein n=1 Tax=Linum tenue TaxID=586396 RepID=A0AAV0NZ89_9ROSI|nr:unnamed protein product [Linum tenue]